jgi:hypothetical protein
VLFPSRESSNPLIETTSISKQLQQSEVFLWRYSLSSLFSFLFSLNFFFDNYSLNIHLGLLSLASCW